MTVTTDPATTLPELARHAVEVVRTVIIEIRLRLVDAALAADPGAQGQRPARGQLPVGA
jgi:hypothetical protein